MTPLLVGVLHGIADPRHQLQTSRERERPATDVLVQRQPADEFHREIELAILGGAGVKDAGDAFVAQPAQDARFLGETLAEVGGAPAPAHDL